MGKTKWWLVALITVFAVVILAAGGYALYRAGYAHGVQVNLVERGLPQRFLDQFDRLDREGKPFGVNPRLQLREFGHRFMFLERDLRPPALFPWRLVIPIVVGVILVALVVILAVALLTRHNHAAVTAPPAAPPSVPQEPADKA